MEEKELLRYIQGQSLSDREIELILNWIEASAENRTKYNELKNLWVLSGLNAPAKQPVRKFFNESSSKILRPQFFRNWYKYAAVFVMAFLTAYLTWQWVAHNQQQQYETAYNEIYVPKGEKSVITLYDGTKVWLNSGTHLRYPVVFSSSSRNVYLEGEAYFHVKKSAGKPFYVHAGELDVKVLGTCFNVYAYENESFISTTLEEGLVEISAEKQKESQQIMPGQQFLYEKSSGKSELKNVDTDLFTSWRESLLRFENAKLSDILKKMERWYDVKMNIQNGIDLNDCYTITIKTESLKEMLDVLSITADIDYKIEADVVTIYKH